MEFDSHFQYDNWSRVAVVVEREEKCLARCDYLLKNQYVLLWVQFVREMKNEMRSSHLLQTWTIFHYSWTAEHLSMS